MRHNPEACAPMLPLSEANPGDASARIALMPARPIGAGGRLTDTARRFHDLNGPRRPSPAFRTERIAATIRAHGGDVWGAVLEFGISYGHACRIRAGWRPGGRRADPIAAAFRRAMAAAALVLEYGLPTSWA
jgi:hypothetical protein